MTAHCVCLPCHQQGPVEQSKRPGPSLPLCQGGTPGFLSLIWCHSSSQPCLQVLPSSLSLPSSPPPPPVPLPPHLLLSDSCPSPFPSFSSSPLLSLLTLPFLLLFLLPLFLPTPSPVTRRMGRIYEGLAEPGHSSSPVIVAIHQSPCLTAESSRPSTALAASVPVVQELAALTSSSLAAHLTCGERQGVKAFTPVGCCPPRNSGANPDCSHIYTQSQLGLSDWVP